MVGGSFLIPGVLFGSLGFFCFCPGGVCMFVDLEVAFHLSLFLGALQPM